MIKILLGLGYALVFLALLASWGCQRPVAPATTSSRLSLDSTDPKERQRAADAVGDQFGAPR